MLKNNKAIALSLITGIILFSLTKPIFATTGTTENTYSKENIINNVDEGKFLQEKENVLNLQGKNYIFDSFSKEEVIPESTTKKYTSETKILTSNSKQYLDKNFDQTYNFEDDDYQGTLNLKDYNIETINNGYYEKIDEIIKEQKGIKKYNDLANISKNINQNGRNYVLINVEWLPETIENKANTNVITTYTARCHYQTIIRTYRPDTYKVSANYEGSVTKKADIGKEKITLLYNKEPEKIPEVKKDNKAVKIALSLAGGLLVLFGGFMLLKPNAKISALDENGELHKIKVFRIKNKKNIDISNKISKTNNYILEMNEKTFNKINGSRIKIVQNGKSLNILVSNKSISFRM